MPDPEVSAAIDDNARLANKFNSLHRVPALAALGLGPDAPPAAAPPPAAPEPPPAPAGADEIRQALARLTFADTPGGAQPARIKTPASPDDIPQAVDLLTARTGYNSATQLTANLLSADLLAGTWRDLHEEYSPEDVMRIKREFFDRARDLHTLKQIQDEYRRLGEEQHGAYTDVDWLLGADPQLVGKLPAGAKKALADLEQAHQTENNLTQARENLCDQIGMAAGITNQQLQELINRDNAYSAAELRYEEILKEYNPPANPGFRNAFDNRNRTATEFYDWAIRLREMRVRYLQRVVPGQPAEAISTARVPEFTQGNQLMQLFDNALRGTHNPSPEIEVFPDTLAGYLKEAVKIPVGKVFMKEITAGFSSTPVLRPASNNYGEEALLFSGSITAPGGEVILNNVLVINSPRAPGLAMSYRDQDITCKGKAAAHQDKVKAALDHFEQNLIGGINRRLSNKDWEVSGLHIQDGRVRFNFARRR